MEGKNYVPSDINGQSVLAVELPKRKRKALVQCNCGDERWIFLFDLLKRKTGRCKNCAYESGVRQAPPRFKEGDFVGNYIVINYVGRKAGGQQYVVRSRDCGHIKTVIDSAKQPFLGTVKHCGVGKCKNSGGYVDWYWYMPDGKRVTVKEHRVVMESVIGRELLAHEEVHHVNGVRDDNRLENLELWSHSQPPGQRVTDKVAWAKDILALYEPEALA